MANTFTAVVEQAPIGNRFLSIYRVTGDGSTTTITAASVGFTYIDAAWLQDVDDAPAAPMSLSTYYGTSIVLGAAISSGKYQLLFLIGH
jgi:hypothetical protein